MIAFGGPTNLRMMQFSEQINVLVFGGGGC